MTTQQPRQLADPNRDGTIFVYSLTPDLPVPELPGCTLRAGTLADAQPLGQAMHESGEYPDDVVMLRLSDGRFPYIVLDRERVVCYGWVALNVERAGDLGIAFRLAEGDAYIYDCATHPVYRGRGLYPALLKLMVSELGRGGWKRTWIGTAPGNAVSQRGIMRAGFAKVADVQLVQRPDGSFRGDVYGTPGARHDLVMQAARSFYATAHLDTGVPLDRPDKQARPDAGLPPAPLESAE